MFRGLIAAIIAVALAPLSLSATTVLPTSFDDLVREAATIVRAETTEVHSEWRDGAAGREIITKVTVQVQRSLKGNAPTTIELVFLGGTIGDTTLELSDRPRFAAGDQDFLFINNAGRPASPLVGFFAGRMPIKLDAFTHREFVTAYDGTPLVSMAAPAWGRSLSGLRAPATAALSPVDIEGRIRERVQR
jgi:hypothetical protein